MGVNFMKGKFDYCNTTQISSLPNFSDIFIDTKYDCLNYGGDWLKDFKTNFDNVINSLIPIFVMAQGFNWVDAMNKAISSRGIDLNPI